jgi:hypothetical protein
VKRNGMTSPVVTLEAEGQFLESPLQGNLHGGFGGGGEETQFGCALCPYLTPTTSTFPPSMRSTTTRPARRSAWRERRP